MALPADGRMDVADTVGIGNAISRLMSPAFKAGTFGLNLVYSETFSNLSNKIKFRKAGYLTAETVGEGAVYLPSDANSQIVDTAVEVTAAKAVVGSPISYEAIKFGAGSADVSRIAAEQGAAIARKFDYDLKALFDSVSSTSTAGSTLDVDTVLTGQYNVFNSECPTGSMVCVIDFKGLLELQKLVASSGAAKYANQNQLTLLNGVPQANGFVGNYLGIDFYATNGLSTTGGDDQGVIFNPQWAFCCGLSGGIETEVYQTRMGVASQVAGLSWAVLSYMFYDVKVWNNSAISEIRSDT